MMDLLELWGGNPPHYWWSMASVGGMRNWYELGCFSLVLAEFLALILVCPCWQQGHWVKGLSKGGT